MSENKPTKIQSHEGRPVGVKVLVAFDPDEAKRLSELAEEAGLSLAAYLSIWSTTPRPPAHARRLHRAGAATGSPAAADGR